LLKIVELCWYRLVFRLAWAVPELTSRTAVLLLNPEVAVIVTFPVATAVAVPVLLIVTTLELDDTHVLEVLRFWVLPSVYVPVALSC
jgi:hypothetical protein